MPDMETDREWLRRRAAEIRAGQADAAVAGVADELHQILAAHDARLDGRRSLASSAQ